MDGGIDRSATFMLTILIGEDVVECLIHRL